MTVMSDGCQPVEAAAKGSDAGYGHAAPGGHLSKQKKTASLTDMLTYQKLGFGTE
jgi:hypothetical protein